MRKAVGFVTPERHTDHGFNHGINHGWLAGGGGTGLLIQY
jgi:hypothetical protein